jgi:hypothetical protein
VPRAAILAANGRSSCELAREKCEGPADGIYFVAVNSSVLFNTIIAKPFVLIPLQKVVKLVGIVQVETPFRIEIIIHHIHTIRQT